MTALLCGQRHRYEVLGTEIPGELLDALSPRAFAEILALESLVPFPPQEDFFTDRSGLRRFEHWTAAGARAGLLRWPERDAYVRAATFYLLRG